MTTVVDAPSIGLTDTQRQVMDLAREFAREHIEPQCADAAALSVRNGR